MEGKAPDNILYKAFFYLSNDVKSDCKKYTYLQSFKPTHFAAIFLKRNIKGEKELSICGRAILYHSQAVWCVKDLGRSFHWIGYTYHAQNNLFKSLINRKVKNDYRENQIKTISLNVQILSKWTNLNCNCHLQLAKFHNPQGFTMWFCEVVLCRLLPEQIVLGVLNLLNPQTETCKV